MGLVRITGYKSHVAVVNMLPPAFAAQVVTPNIMFLTFSILLKLLWNTNSTSDSKTNRSLQRQGWATLL